MMINGGASRRQWIGSTFAARYPSPRTNRIIQFMRLIIFDIDGTLLDSKAIILAAHAATYAQHGLPTPSEAAIMGLVGMSLPEIFRILAGPDDPAESLMTGYQQAVWEFRATGLHAERPFPGAIELVDRLGVTPGVKLALATGKGRRGTDRVIAQYGWQNILSSSQSADENPSKPDPTMLNRAMAIAGATPAETVMIGDAVFDMQMAVSAGVTPIGVAWGHQPTEALIAAGAVAVATDMADLAKLIDTALIDQRLPR